MPDFESIRQTPQSSTIACIQYAPKERVLRVKFKGLLGHYDYFDVQPGQIADLFVTDESIGKCFDRFKKLGHRYEKKEYTAVGQ